MNNQDKIIENIKMHRKQQDLTQQEMAERLHMSVTGYAKIEQGKTGLDAKRLYQIAEVLNVGLYDLVPNNNDSVVVITNSSDVLNNSPFSIAIGSEALESEVKQLKYMLDAKDEVLAAREREIKSLKDQIEALQKLITILEH